jgi:hypothetical protein
VAKRYKKLTAGPLVITHAFHIKGKKIVPNVRIYDEANDEDFFLDEKAIKQLIAALPIALERAKKELIDDGK